jgi:Zn-dependent protease
LIFGLLALVILKIGWAKPVPINPMKFRKRKSGTILVSLADRNEFAAGVFVRLLYKITLGLNDFVTYLFLYSMIVNVGLGVFNLLPLPPLDGSKILASLLPQKWKCISINTSAIFSLLVLNPVFHGVVSAVICP